MNKTIVACYCRVSTKKEEQILSLENQRKTFEEYVEKNNMEIYKVYVDNGVSAKSMKKRDGFNQMIRDAKAGDFSKILVKDISRFARNTKDFLEIIRDLKKNGVEVYFINAKTDRSYWIFFGKKRRMFCQKKLAKNCANGELNAMGILQGRKKPLLFIEKSVLFVSRNGQKP